MNSIRNTFRVVYNVYVTNSVDLYIVYECRNFDPLHINVLHLMKIINQFFPLDVYVLVQNFYTCPKAASKIWFNKEVNSFKPRNVRMNYTSILVIAKWLMTAFSISLAESITDTIKMKV